MLLNRSRSPYMALDFRNFDKRLIVILEEEKRIIEAYKRWRQF